MKIEPNRSVGMTQECILCEGDDVVVFDGTRTSRHVLGSESSPFRAFCNTLDPNMCFVVALIVEEGGREAFFEARRVAGELGLHVQAPVETAERCREMWSAYLQLKQLPSVDDDTNPTEANTTTE